MVKGEAPIARLPASDRGPDRVWYGSAAASEFHDADWLNQHIREDEDVTVTSLTNDMTILLLAGPKARDVLATVSREDWSAKAFPWLSVRECFVGIAPATVMAVSFSGELAYELHIPNASLYAAYLALREAGEAHGMKLFGLRAVESMRLEKGFLHWKADLLTEFDPYETGLDRFVAEDKPDFIGKSALAQRKSDGPTRAFVTLNLAHTDGPGHPGASMMQDGRVIGSLTSASWGHRTGMNLAMGFVESEFAQIGTRFTVDLLGDAVSAEVISPSPYDPKMTLPRGCPSQTQPGGPPRLGPPVT
jgi:dimethylglycine dehydrogenase